MHRDALAGSSVDLSECLSQVAARQDHAQPSCACRLVPASTSYITVHAGTPTTLLEKTSDRRASFPFILSCAFLNNLESDSNTASFEFASTGIAIDDEHTVQQSHTASVLDERPS